MSASANVNELIQVAIQAERAAEEIFRQLRRLFNHIPEVALFIDRYASEEAGHVVWLESLRAKLSEEKLAAPAVPMIYQDAQRARQGSLSDKLELIETLEDAYQLLEAIVDGEANQVLEAIINTYYEDKKTRLYLLDHLHQHLGRLKAEFPGKYGSRRARQAVKVKRS